MTRREQLQDRYEDALFALLMDEIATAEGEKAEAENERLKNDPSAVIPEDLDKRCMRTIRREFAKRRVRSVGRFTAKAMKRVALAAGIAAILFTTAFAASETVRVNTLNLMIEVFETNTEFRFSGKKDENISRFSVAWVPEGYILMNHETDSRKTRYEYKGPEGQSLVISCRKTQGVVANIDTEDAEAEYVSVQGERAMLVQKNSTVQLVWPANGNSLLLSIMGNEIDSSDILYIASKLEY